MSHISLKFQEVHMRAAAAAISYLIANYDEVVALHDDVPLMDIGDQEFPSLKTLQVMQKQMRSGIAVFAKEKMQHNPDVNPDPFAEVPDPRTDDNPDLQDVGDWTRDDRW